MALVRRSLLASADVQFWLADVQRLLTSQPRPRGSTRCLSLWRRAPPPPRPSSSSLHSSGKLLASAPTGRRRWAWFGIPVSAGLACLAGLQLVRTLRREGRNRPRPDEGPAATWQLTLFRQLPARLLSRCWGRLMESSVPVWLRRPLLGGFVWVFGCNMSEAEEEDVAHYRSLAALFTRELKPAARPIDSLHPLVCPADGRVLHFGRVERGTGRVEQVKGVHYPLSSFLGPDSPAHHPTPAPTAQHTDLFHIVVYLAPGDYHHFHSPAEWTAQVRRHFHGELLTVAPWAARTMPGLFVLNERATLLGSWQYGFFSLTAVGAYNVGSIHLELDPALCTNQVGHYKMGQFTEKQFGSNGGHGGVEVGKGERLGCFGMGSSIVLVFEAPSSFQFCVGAGDKVVVGQPLGQPGQPSLDPQPQSPTH